MLKVSRDKHRMGRVALVGGTTIACRYVASLGNHPEQATGVVLMMD